MSPRPPRIARAILRLSAPPDVRDALVGDLDEEFHTHQVTGRGGGGARWWYRRQVLASAPGMLLDRVREALADAWSAPGGAGPWLRDVRFAARQLGRRPGLSALAVGSLALGIGGTSLAYAVVDGVVLRPFPYPEADRLVAVGVQRREDGARLDFVENVSPPEFIDVRAASRTLERFYAFDAGPAEVRVAEGTRAVTRALGWGDAFATLGVQPHLGRGFAPSEMEPVGAPVAVLSHRLWVSGFGADSSIVGRTVEVDRTPRTVVGIMPQGVLLYDADVWTPGGSPPGIRPRGPRRLFQILARIRPDFDLADVDDELRTLSARIATEHLAEYPEYEGWTLRARTWTHANVRDHRALALLTLAGVAVSLLLICANLAGLLLASALRRGRELAVRRSLGAGRGSIARLLLTESLLLALAGGALGTLGAVVASRAVDRAVVALANVPGGVQVSGGVLVFTVAATLLAAAVTGLLPAVRATRNDPAAFLRTEGPGVTTSRADLRLQHLLVAIQMAVAIVLLSATGATVRSFVGHARVELGFDARNVLVTRLDLPPEEYGPEESRAFYTELERRLAALPTVTDAAVAFRTPGHPLGPREVMIDAGGAPTTVSAMVTYATPAYLDLLGLRARSGRLLGSNLEGSAVAVVNEELVRRFAPTADPLTLRVRDEVEDDAPWLSVVGGVPTVRNAGVRAPPGPEVFVSLGAPGTYKTTLFVLARTAEDPWGVEPALRRTVAELDPYLPPRDLATLEQALASPLTALRVGVVALLGIGALALVLAGLGIGSVVWFAASRRVREIGLRRVLGATAPELRASMARATLTPALSGALAGGLLATLAGTIVPVGTEVGAPGPWIVGASVLVLALAATGCAVLPAWRASAADPAEVLRAE